MSYATLPAVAIDQIIAESWGNQVKANFDAGPNAIATAAGQTFYATAAGALAALTAPSSGAIMIGAGGLPSWLSPGASGDLLTIVAGAPAWTAAPASAPTDPVAGTAGLRTLGTGAQQAAAGDHTHAVAAPAAHATTHQPGGSDAMAVDAVVGTGSLRTIGTGAQQAAAGNHTHSSGSPSAHATTHNAGGSDVLAIDAAAGTGSLRTLGTGSAQAAAGDHTHAGGGVAAHVSTHVAGGSDAFTSSHDINLGHASFTGVSISATKSPIRMANDTFVYSKTSGGTEARVIGLAGDDYVRIFNASLNIGSTGGVCVGSPSGGDLGAGKLNVEINVYKANSLYNNPDYVLEHWATGQIARYRDREGADGYLGLKPLAEVEAFAREHHQLPGVARVNAKADADAGTGIFTRTDIALELLEELFIHAFDFNRRLARLEAPRS